MFESAELNDGSHLFRFGDASEIERYLEIEAKLKKQQAKLAEEASEVSRKQEVKDGHTLVDLDRVSELDGPKEKSVFSSIETGSEKDERAAAPSNLNNVVIKIKDRKRIRSPTKKKKEISTSVNVSRSEDKVEAKVASVSNLSSIVSVAEAIPTSSTEEKVVVSRESEPINENVEPLSSQVIEKVSVNEVENCEITNGYQQLTENRLEVQGRPRSSTSQHGSQSYDLEEVAHVSTIELDENLDVRETPMTTFEAEENLVVEPTATATVSPDELITTSEATHHSVDKISETPVIDMSEVVSPNSKSLSSFNSCIRNDKLESVVEQNIVPPL